MANPIDSIREHLANAWTAIFCVEGVTAFARQELDCGDPYFVLIQRATAATANRIRDAQRELRDELQKPEGDEAQELVGKLDAYIATITEVQTGRPEEPQTLHSSLLLRGADVVADGTGINASAAVLAAFVNLVRQWDVVDGELVTRYPEADDVEAE